MSDQGSGGDLEAMIEEASHRDISRSSKAAVNLEQNFEHERDRRKEERFLFVVIITVLADALIFPGMGSWSGPIVIGVIQLFGLMVFARHCGVQEVDWLLERLLRMNPFREQKDVNRRKVLARRRQDGRPPRH